MNEVYSPSIVKTLSMDLSCRLRVLSLSLVPGEYKYFLSFLLERRNVMHGSTNLHLDDPALHKTMFMSHVIRAWLEKRNATTDWLNQTRT